MFTYRQRIRDRMLEATRLTRTKQLLKAATFIHHTLRDVVGPNLRSDHPDKSSDESVVEGTFHVVEPEGAAGPVPTPESNLQQVEVTILTHPASDRVEPSPEPTQAPTQLVIPPANAASGEGIALNAPTEAPTVISELPLPLRFPRRLRQEQDKVSESQPVSPPPQTEEARPDQGRFLSESYTNGCGTRAYKLYVPSSYHGQALPLVVMLHGCTQSPDDFATATRMNEFAETHSFLVAYPAQIFKANLGKCWNWFKTSEQQRDRGEPAIIAGLTGQIIATYGLDTRRVYVAGISAGGAMAMVMGATYPDLYAAVGIQSGVAYGVAHNIPSGLMAIKGGGSTSADRLTSAPGSKDKLRVVPTIVFHGDRDSIVHPNNSEQIIAQWLELWGDGTNGPAPQITVHHGQVPAGHAYTRSVYHDGGGPTLMERWLVHGAGHAWSGGSPNVMFTEPKGPDATQEMLRFFYEHPHPEA